MTALEALDKLCETCHNAIQSIPSKGYLPHRECPWRHISGDYCDKVETIKKSLEVLEMIRTKAKGNRFFKGCLLRMFQEQGRKESLLDNPPRSIDENYYKVKQWLEE